MKGAGRRAAYIRADMAEAMFVAVHAAKPRDVQHYVDAQRGADAPVLPPEALSGALRSASSGLQTITRAEYLKSKEV